MASGKPSITEKLSKANEYKELGNAKYKAGNYKSATRQYHNAILYLKAIDNDLHGTPAFLQSASVDPDSKFLISKEVEQECIRTNVSVYNNLAACLLLKGDADPVRIIENVDIVIELDERNEKAWYRKGQALMRLSKYEEAKQCFAETVKCGGRQEDKNIARLVRECDIAIAKEEKEMKAVYKEMTKGLMNKKD